MKATKGQKQSVTNFQAIAERLAEKLPTKTKTFFLALILGALLAVARRRRIERSAMFFDPGMKGEGRASDFTSDLGGGNMRCEHEIDGAGANVVGVMNAWHDGSAVRGEAKSIRQSDR